jgi:VPDSG-CTERM motif
MKTSTSIFVLTFFAFIGLRSLQGDTIDLTENSSTVLQATGDVSSVTNTGSDSWTVFLSDPNALVFTGPGVAWAELESSFTGNVITSSNSTGVPVAGELFVTSDMITALSKNANGSQVLVAGEIINPSGPPTPTDFQITFTDNAATAEAPVSTPDTGSTFVLLSLALTALVGASRFRYLRLA